MTHNPILLNLVSTQSDIYNVLLWIYQCVWEKAKAKAPTPYVAVELGVRCGDSTIALLCAMEQAQNGILYSCDIEPCEHAKNLVAKLKTDRWKFSQSDSVAFASQFWHHSVDLVFLDTSHEYEQTVKELDLWSDKLVAGGRMLIHDTLSRPEGVGKPVQEFLASRPDWKYYNIDTFCGLGVLDRPLANSGSEVIPIYDVPATPPEP